MSEGVDYDNFLNLADELVSVAVDALSRRRGLGKTQSAEYRGILKVANANSELFKQRGLQDTVPVDPDDFDSAQDIAKFRSRMLTLAREAAGDPNRATEAKMYGEMAAAALRDLDAGLDVGANKAYDAARAFSFGFNEGIRRTFIGDATGVNRFGADLTTPELLIPKIFSGAPLPVHSAWVKSLMAQTSPRVRWTNLRHRGYSGRHPRVGRHRTALVFSFFGRSGPS